MGEYACVDGRLPPDHVARGCVVYSSIYSIDLWHAAATPKSQAFLMIGTLFLLPIIMTYFAWSYWVFRGKVKADTPAYTAAH